MSFEELLKKLGIDKKGTTSTKGSYVIDLMDYDEYGEMFSLLDKNNELEELEDSTQITIHTTSITFLYDDFTIDLVGDLDNDEYKLVITKIKQ